MKLPVMEEAGRGVAGGCGEAHLKMAGDVTVQLLNCCRGHDWAGHDPYDALNSRLFNALPFLQFTLPRLVFTQVLKRSPVNLRPLLMVPRTQNPKGLSLFLSAVLKLQRGGLLSDGSLVGNIAQKLLDLQSEKMEYACWGYNFPWQTRITLVPRGCPN